MPRPKRNSGIGREWKCEICKQMVPSTISHSDHIRTHPPCLRCAVKFGSKLELIAHQRSSGHLYCDLCDTHFASVIRHLKHVRGEDVEEKDDQAKEEQDSIMAGMSSGVVCRRIQWFCPGCSRCYLDDDSLRHHCCKCDRVFQSSEALMGHLAAPTHAKSAGRPPPLACHVCKEGFPRNKQLRAHVHAAHTDADFVPCPTAAKSGCTESFATLDDLLMHFRDRNCKSRLILAAAHGAAIEEGKEEGLEGQTEQFPIPPPTENMKRGRRGRKMNPSRIAAIVSRDWAAKMFQDRLFESKNGFSDLLNGLDSMRLLPAASAYWEAATTSTTETAGAIAVDNIAKDEKDGNKDDDGDDIM